MNKVFKVVYSKSKGCYVVVPETAKNNNGKKKVLASVLAGLAVAGAMGGIAPQQAMADADYGNSHVNVWANTAPDGSNGKNDAGQNSIVVGYQNKTDHTAGNDGKVAIGAKNSATGNSAMAMGNRNVANGGAATAIGAGNESTAATTLTVGNKNNANAENAIAIGAYNNQNWTHGSWQTTPKPAGAYSLAIGNFNDALGSRATAVGAFNTAKGEWATAIGASTVASGNGDVAIGDTSKTNATGVGHAVAVGWHAETGAANAVAVGPSALASGKNSVSVGTNNNSRVQDTVTMGQDNDAKTMGGIAIGKNNMVDSTNGGTNFAETADENSQIAIGRDNTATHLDTIAIGRETHATGSGATVIGARAEASGNNSIAIGQSGKNSPRVIASGENTIAVGMQSQAAGASGIAIGAASNSTGDYAVAMGRLSRASAKNATALGNEARATFETGVALGSNSITTSDKGVVGYNPSDLHNRKYTNLQGNVQTATNAAVSIGADENMTRQLTGLAAGTKDTDAVNVAQLKNVGVAVTGNTGSSDFLTDGGKLNVRGEGRVSVAASDDGAKDSKLTLKFDDTNLVKGGRNVTVDTSVKDGKTTYTINAADTAAKYDFLTNATANGGKVDGEATATKVQSGTTVNYAAGKNLTVKQDIETSLGQQTYTYSLNKDLKEITSITNNGGPTMHFGDNNISITGGNLDLGGNNITNLKSGGDVINNAANIGDVTRISKANDLHIAPTAGTNNNVAEYTVDGNKKVTLTYQDGNGKTVNGPKAVIDLSGLKTGDMSSFNVKSSATEGKVAQGSAGVQEIKDGKTVEMQAGKNMTIKQTNKDGNAQVEFALNKNVDLTPDGSLKIGDTNITDNGLTINGGPSITKTGINAGDLNITNVKAGVNDNDAVNVSQLKQVRADERHIKPGEYAVDNNGKVTMTYLDGNNKDVPNETAVITGIAKQDLSNINNGGKTVIKNLAKEAIDMENGKNTTASHRDVNGVKTFKVDVEGDLTDITSITNKDGDGKIAFGGNQTVNVAGDHNINLNAKVGDITGLTNVTLDAPDFAKKGRAATEEQLNIVNNGFNNTVGLTGNTGATELQKLNKQGGLSFGVVGANNGEYIKTTASGSNVVADLSDSAKNKLNSTVVVEGKNAAKVTSNVIQNADGSTKTVYTVDVNNVKPTAASTEKVQAKADVAGSSDKNIAKVSPKAGENFGDAGATYEVNVSRNDVKDAAREAVTVNTTNTTNNPITVTPVQDEANHNTTYQVTFDGDKAAKQIPLAYKANGTNEQKVTLDKGLNFTNGKNTTASVDAEGVVKYDVNKDLVNINSISNTTNGPKMEFGPNSINITNGPINMGDQNITNLKSGGDVVNNAANIGDVTRISKANDLHIAPTSSNRQGETTTSYAYDAASKSVTLKYNDGNGANQSGTVAKIDLSGLADQIKDGYSFSTDAKGNVVGNHAVTPVANGKTVSYAAGKNLTVAQNIDNATGEHTYTYALSNDVDLTPNGSLKIGDTILNNGGLTITGGPSVTKTGINAGNLNITNVKAGVNDTDAVNVKQLKDARTVVTSNDNSVTVNKTENGNQVTYDLHVAPGAAQSVWNVKSTGNTTADSEATAKTITDGKTVEMAAGKNLTVKQTSNNDGAKVEYALSDDIKVGNDGKDGKDGVDGKIGVNGKDGSSVVINGKDGSIGLNGKDGKDGLSMKAEKGQPGVNGKDGITRIVYEDKTNNKHEVATLDDGLKFTGNNTDTVNNHKLNSLVKVQGEGVDKTTSASFKSAAGNINVKADGTDTLELQLNKDLKNITSIKNEGPATFTIGGNEFKFDGGNVNMGDNNITNLKSGGDVINNAANIGDVNRISKANDIHVKDKTYTVNADKTVTLEYVDGNDNTVNKTAKIDLSNLPTGDKAAVESVVKKSAAAGDTNIADITVADGKQTGDANAKYEVNVSRNAVKDAAREAVTVNTTNTTNNPITVTPVQDETNHNTTYQVTFDGDKAAKQIPLTYKANGSNDQKVTLDKGLNFTNGSNTTASVAADGVVKYDLNNNVNLTPSGSLTIGDTVVNNGGLTISGGPSVLKTGINAGNLNITNVKAGVNDTDAVNVKQLKDSRTVVTSNDNSVTVNKTENGNQVTYDLHVAPGAAQSVWNVKSTGNTTADSETTAKTITDGKTVEMAAGKNLTVKQTSNNDGAKVEYALSDDIKVGNDGKDGKDGVDGKIGVNGKDGSSVVINGKDGSIGLNGKDGKDGLTIRGANGQDGVNGTNGITRIVYEDKNNNKHEVATTDDGLKFTGNNTDVVNKNKLNSLVKVQGEGVDKTTSASFKSASGNINVKADGTDTLEVQLNKDLKNITSIKNDGPATMTIGGNEFKFDGGNVNMGDNNITNLKSGGDVVNNAANIGDVTRISKANDLHIAPTQSNRAGETTTSYSYDAADKSVTLKYNDGNGANQAGTIAKIDLSGLADQIKDGYSFSTDAKGNVVGNHAVTAVGNGKTVSYAAGDNLTITQNIDNATGEQTYTYALSNDIKVGNDGKDGKDGVDGKIGVNGKDGSSVVINGKDGSIGLNGKDGKDGLTMKAKDGQPGVNGKDGITRIVYEDNSKNTHEVATLDDGMKYAGDDAQGADKSKVIAKKLNETMDVVGGADKSKLTDNNIGVNNVDGKLKVQLSKEVNLTPSGSLTIGDTVVNDNGLSIHNGPSITKGGINAGDLNITNVKAGVNDTDAVNVKQLKSAKTEVKAGDNVTVDKTIGADGQNIYTVNAKATNLGDAELNYTANGGAKQKVKLSEGLNFVDGNYTKASVDANGVVKYDVTLGKVRDGVDGKPGVDGDNGIATVKTVVDTINNSGWKGDVTGNTVGNHSATIVKPGTTVNFGAGKNLTVEQIVNAVTGDHTYNYALSDDIKVGNDGKDGKPGVDGKIGVNGKDGSAVVINGKDGSIGLNGKDGKDGLTFKGANGQDGVDGKNGTDGMTRIVYEDSNNNKHEVATTDDGLKFTGNNESVVNKNKLNSTVKVKGEGVTEEQEKTFESAAGNIAVTADGNDTLNIRLNKNIKGIDSIQTKEIHLGTPDNYTTIKKDGDRIKYGDKTFANTDDIWTIQANGTDVPANGGKVNVKGADGITVSKSANGEMTISGAGLGTMSSFNVKSSGNTTADSETAAKKITDGKTVEFSGGKNLTVKQTSDENGAKVEYALSNNVNLTNEGSLTVGDTKITDGGLVINNGPSVTKDGINAGNKQITNVEDGVNDTDAVNVRQLKAAKTNLVDGQNTKVTGDGSKANPYKVNVEGDLNKITSITNKEGDGKLEFKGDQVVNVAGDNTIKLDGKTGDITGLTNKTLDSADFATKGRAATEEQLKLVQQEAAKKSTEKVQAKADANNIAKVAPKAGDTFGAAGATYEVSVDKNDVKDAAREAVTVTGDNKAITVDVQPNATNHTTNYQVNFNGKEAAKQIPLTYKENGGNARTVMLSDGLDFSNGVNTTAHTDANGKVSFDVKGDLTNITSISNNSNGPKVSFGGDTVNITGGNLNMGGNKITNVQRGTNDTDAVNVKQLKDSRTTLTSDDHSVVLKKTESADGGLNYDLSVKGAVDPRVDKLTEEVGRVGAQGAALSALKPMQYDPLEPTQIMAGYGNYRGNSAIAVGVAHYKNESTMFHGGLSWAGGSSHMMANAGVTWKVGNRDAEAAVADRYRKGPISSAYAVQTEMAAMKAQNAGLKGEVSDLKYENEQIKAQNAGLQSEVEVLKAQMAAMMAKMGM
ncbi:MAG: YadA-like family protein [Veillonella dispar]|uniref:ESPR-type extended signal peptide-containing protein n=1 Tax=Veillonella dispar TaxID=39778 RepID=UPI0026EE56D9|nr:ESPR-type extended signal peptide-containing protein [Veillonella dispar]MBS7064777.1 YadA-like family protein [Veillonella dispar]